MPFITRLLSTCLALTLLAPAVFAGHLGGASVGGSTSDTEQACYQALLTAGRETWGSQPLSTVPADVAAFRAAAGEPYEWPFGVGLADTSIFASYPIMVQSLTFGADSGATVGDLFSVIISLIAPEDADRPVFTEPVTDYDLKMYYLRDSGAFLYCSLQNRSNADPAQQLRDVPFDQIFMESSLQPFEITQLEHAGTPFKQAIFDYASVSQDHQPLMRSQLINMMPRIQSKAYNPYLLIDDLKILNDQYYEYGDVAHDQTTAGGTIPIGRYDYEDFMMYGAFFSLLRHGMSFASEHSSVDWVSSNGYVNDALSNELHMEADDNTRNRKKKFVVVPTITKAQHLLNVARSKYSALHVAPDGSAPEVEVPVLEKKVLHGLRSIGKRHRDSNNKLDVDAYLTEAKQYTSSIDFSDFTFKTPTKKQPEAVEADPDTAKFIFFASIGLILIALLYSIWRFFART